MQISKETHTHFKRDPYIHDKRHTHFKRDSYTHTYTTGLILVEYGKKRKGGNPYTHQKRPTRISKRDEHAELSKTSAYIKRDLHIYRKSPTHTSKERNTQHFQRNRFHVVCRYIKEKENLTNIKRDLYSRQKRPRYRSKETYTLQKRPQKTSKETNTHIQRDRNIELSKISPLSCVQKHTSKETLTHIKRHTYPHQKRPIHTSKESSTHIKRVFNTHQKSTIHT